MLTHLKNIYLADDDIDDVLFFREALQTIAPHCNLTIASNGQELVGKLENATDNPDIIFIDVNMPVMNGLEALKTIKENKLDKAAPLITYSTSNNLEMASLAKAYGANFYVVKPADFNLLKEKINKLLSYNWKEWKMPDELKRYIL
ncbi:response regulator [Flavobacterium sp. Sd200]|uniref:response regulator n=1 Tax=Flavobacterium sp. Sd200 TaxID=2692211 RepID=UPI00137208A9|nr:response regulator [Flavobacterium sp. Sd200]MXN91720.1 response regulator [Flavobacterium sp. Sd200]